MTVAGEPAAVGAIGFSAGDSVIRSWLERSVASASVRLEGIIPGGVVPGTGDTVPIGYLTLKFTRLGRTTLAVRDPEVYLNLSVPTRDRVNADQLTITVSAEAPEAAGSPPMAQEGTYVTVFHAQEFLGGAWSLAYDIRTSSGPVATALIRERLLGLFGGWREISSPASLSDQSRLSIVDVGIPTDSGVRIVYREVPVRLIALAALLGAAAIAFVAYRRMKR